MHVHIRASRAERALDIGVTSDPTRRLDQHGNHAMRTACSSRYQTDRLPRVEAHPTILDAIAREKQPKGWRRAKTRALIRRLHPPMNDDTARWR